MIVRKIFQLEYCCFPIKILKFTQPTFLREAVQMINVQSCWNNVTTTNVTFAKLSQLSVPAG